MIVEEKALFIRGVDVNREGRGVWIQLSVGSNVSARIYSAALDLFLEFGVHLGVYGKVCLGPSF